MNNIVRVGAIILCGVVVGCSQTPQPAAERSPLYDNLGSYHHAVTTSSPDAQKYFDQGLTLSYAFNHAEAIRAFQQASAIDPSCAMCYWGVAFALGPNINAPITEDAAKGAFQAIGEARQRLAKATDNERAYIEALANRYVADPKAERGPLDAAYAAAMRTVAQRFPDDLDAATLFAQSLMDTSPWNYWNLDGSPRPLTNEVVSTLESVLSRKSDHLGAIHLYIHAVEASPDPRRAERYAEKLAALAPGAGHLVHMPAHIFLRTGRYADASAANRDAIKADETYFAGNAVAGNMMYQVGYQPHNYHFLVTSASMEGRHADAAKAAKEVRGRLHADMLRDPAMGGMVQHMHLTPLFTAVRFGRWADVMAEPAPPADLPYMNAIWHSARGLAHAAEGRMADARKELEAVAAVKDNPGLKTLSISSVNFAASIVAIANEILAGEIAVKAGRGEEATKRFAAAVAIEDGLTYMEPPDWPIPARQLQGGALLELRRPRDAENAFRADLRKFPDNGWSLSGLAASLKQQGRAAEATASTARLEQQWRNADVELVASRAGDQRSDKR